jgi:hypothetical protein
VSSGSGACGSLCAQRVTTTLQILACDKQLNLDRSISSKIDWLLFFLCLLHISTHHLLLSDCLCSIRCPSPSPAGSISNLSVLTQTTPDPVATIASSLSQPPPSRHMAASDDDGYEYVVMTMKEKCPIIILLTAVPDMRPYRPTFPWPPTWSPAPLPALPYALNRTTATWLT